MSNMKHYLSEMVEQYARTLLWTGTEENAQGEVVELDTLYDMDDISDEAWHVMRAECAVFLEVVWQGVPVAAELSASDMGHNLALSRNGHGTGFWDRGWGADGDRLHEFAKICGEQNLYSTDDGKLEVA